MTKVVFVESTIEKQDILLSSFREDVVIKVQSTFNESDLEHIPDTVTHVSFLYHETNEFPFYTSEHIEWRKDISEYIKRHALFNETDPIPEMAKEMKPFVSNLNDSTKDLSLNMNYTDDIFTYDEFHEIYEMYINNQGGRRPTYFTKDIVNLIDVLSNKHPNITIDFITCNMWDRMSKEMLSLHKQTGLTLRFSTDTTGNKPVGDWHMECVITEGKAYKDLLDENKNNNVKSTYFTDLIQDWDVLLSANAGIILYGPSMYETNGTLLTNDYVDTNRGRYYGFKLTCMPDIFSYDATSNTLSLERDIHVVNNGSIRVKFYDAYNSSLFNPNYVAYTENHDFVNNVSKTGFSVTEVDLKFIKATTEQDGLIGLGINEVSFDGKNHKITVDDFTGNNNYREDYGIASFLIDNTVSTATHIYISNLRIENHINNVPGRRNKHGQIVKASHMNVHLTNVHLKCGDFMEDEAGGMAGKGCFGIDINNCSVEANIRAIDFGGIIGSLSVLGANVEGSSYKGTVYGTNVGGIIGPTSMNAKIDNCTSEAVFKNGDNGGFSGANMLNGTITNSSFIGDIGTDTTSIQCSGYVTRNSSGTIENCRTIGNIESKNCSGFVGNLSKLTVKKCIFIGDINGANSNGIIQDGNGGTEVDECVMIGNINASNCGGIASIMNYENSSIIKNSLFIGDITQPRSAGIVNAHTKDAPGNMSFNETEEVRVTNCYAKCAQRGGYSGLIGGNKLNKCIFNECFALGTIHEKQTGGILGYDNDDCTIENCYTDIQWGENTITDFTLGDENNRNYDSGGISAGKAKNQTIRNCYTTMDVYNRTLYNEVNGYIVSKVDSTETYTLTNNYYSYSTDILTNIDAFKLLEHAEESSYVRDDIGVLHDLPLLKTFLSGTSPWISETYQNYNSTPVLQWCVDSNITVVTRYAQFTDANLKDFTSIYDFSGATLEFAQNIPPHLIQAKTECLEYISNVNIPTSTSPRSGDNLQISLMNFNQSNVTLGNEIYSSYSLTKGIYILNIPTEYPISLTNVTNAENIELNSTDTVKATIGTNLAQTTFYFGKVELTVKNDFGVASIYVKDKGFLYTQNKLRFDYKCLPYYLKSKMLYKINKVFLVDRIQVIQPGTSTIFSDGDGNYRNNAFIQQSYAAPSGYTIKFTIEADTRFEDGWDFMGVHVSDDGEVYTCMNDVENLERPSGYIPSSITNIDTVNGSSFSYILKHKYSSDSVVETNKKFVMFTFDSDYSVVFPGWDIVIEYTETTEKDESGFKLMDKLQTDLVLDKMMYIINKTKLLSPTLQQEIVNILLEDRVFYSVEFQDGQPYSLIDILLGREMTEFRAAGYTELDLVRATFSTLTKRQRFYGDMILKVFRTTHYITTKTLDSVQPGMELPYMQTDLLISTLNSFENNPYHAFGNPDISYGSWYIQEYFNNELMYNKKSNIYKIFEILHSSKYERKHKLYNYINKIDSMHMPMIYKFIEPLSTSQWSQDYKTYNVSLIRDETFKNKGEYEDAKIYDEMYFNPIFSRGYKDANNTW